MSLWRPVRVLSGRETHPTRCFWRSVAALSLPATSFPSSLVTNEKPCIWVTECAQISIPPSC